MRLFVLAEARYGYHPPIGLRKVSAAAATESRRQNFAGIERHSVSDTRHANVWQAYGVVYPHHPVPRSRCNYIDAQGAAPLPEWLGDAEWPNMRLLPTLLARENTMESHLARW